MILELNQTKSSASCEYELMHLGVKISEASQRNNVTVGGTVEFHSFLDGRDYVLDFRHGQEIRNMADDRNAKQFLYEIKDADGNVFGELYSEGVTSGFDNPAKTLHLEYGARSCTMYEVGLGRKGYKFPIYEGTEQTALIEKDCTVKGNLDTYRIYGTDEENAYLGYILGLYLDVVLFAHRAEKATRSVKISAMKTTKAEILAKYDPAFAERIPQ